MPFLIGGRRAILRRPALVAAGATRIFDASTGLRPTGWTLAGAAYAQYVDSTGLTTYGPNNLLLNSNDPNAWADGGKNATIGSLVSDPMGGTNARRLTFTGSGYFYGLTSTSPWPDSNYIGSLYIRAPSGKNNIGFRLSDGNTGSPDVRVLITLTSSWQRVGGVGVWSGGGTRNPVIGLDNRTTIVSGTDGASGDVDVFGGMVERVTSETTPRTYVSTGSSRVFGERLDHSATTPFPLLGLLYQTGDNASFTLGSGATALAFTFDDNSTQTVSGLTSGSTYTIPTTLTRARIMYIDQS